MAARLPATALAALALAGCGAEETARDVVDPIAEAADRTVAAGGARIEGAALFQVEGQEVEATIRGIVDFDDERSRIRMRFPGLTEQEQREAGFPHDEIRDGLTKYVSTPLLREQIDARWAKVDFGEMADDAGIDTEILAQSDESDPRELLRFLEAAGGAKPAGREWIGGSRTTRYDANGLIRREEVDLDMVIYGERIEGMMRLDLNDFGDRHDVVLPDDGDAVDVTDEWDKYKVHFTG